MGSKTKPHKNDLANRESYNPSNLVCDYMKITTKNGIDN